MGNVAKTLGKSVNYVTAEDIIYGTTYQFGPREKNMQMHINPSPTYEKKYIYILTFLTLGDDRRVN